MVEPGQGLAITVFGELALKASLADSQISMVTFPPRGLCRVEISVTVMVCNLYVATLIYHSHSEMHSVDCGIVLMQQ